MPSGSYIQVFVLCPFYKYDDGKKSIVCEGIVDNSSIVTAYHAKADYEKHITDFCCGRFDECETFKLLMEKYEA